MKSKLFIIAILVAICQTTFAQRLSYTDLTAFYSNAVNNQYETIHQRLKKISINWSEPQLLEKGTEMLLIWKYEFELNAMGLLKVYKDKNPKFPARLVFSFPYLVQFNEYKKYLDANSQLVNRSSENGSNSLIYENSTFTTVLTTYPANLKKFYRDGLPVEYYQILIHIKL